MEKCRNRTLEQEAFHARCQLAKVDKELSHIREHIKLVEQERDVLRSIAQKEEVERIAAEGHIPLPFPTHHDEFSVSEMTRPSVEPAAIVCSASSEQELDSLLLLLSWEKQCASRAHDRIEFLEIECKLKGCASMAKSQDRQDYNTNLNLELIPHVSSEQTSPTLNEIQLKSSTENEPSPHPNEKSININQNVCN